MPETLLRNSLLCNGSRIGLFQEASFRPVVLFGESENPRDVLPRPGAHKTGIPDPDAELEAEFRFCHSFRISAETATSIVVGICPGTQLIEFS